MTKNKNCVDSKKYNLQVLSQTEISDNGLDFFPDDYLSLYFEFFRLKVHIDDFLMCYTKGNI